MKSHTSKRQLTSKELWISGGSEWVSRKESLKNKMCLWRTQVQSISGWIEHIYRKYTGKVVVFMMILVTGVPADMMTWILKTVESLPGGCSPIRHGERKQQNKYGSSGLLKGMCETDSSRGQPQLCERKLHSS